MKFNFFISIAIFITSLSSTANSEKALHLLNRFSYGPKPHEVENLSKQGQAGLNTWFEKQLNPAPVQSAKLKALTSLSLSNTELFKLYPNKKNKIKAEKNKIAVLGPPQLILKELTFQKIINATESENQFSEVLLDFWFNHFNVSFEKGSVKYFITNYEAEAIRPFLFGNFKDMLLAVAKSPAMLYYLDNLKSKSGKINENYARELLELHTLGVNAGYTQKDIQETARILTGWGIEKPRDAAQFKFFKNQHDQGSKLVLGKVYPINGGLLEGEKLIEFLAYHEKTAEFIAKKIAIKFISDNPSDVAILKLKTSFMNTRGNLKEVYKTLFKMDEFWDSKNFNSKVKNPFELMISSLRLLDVPVNVEFEKMNIIKKYLDQSGQPLYRCQPPTGFSAKSEHWVSSGALVNRINFSLKLTNNEIPQMSFDKTKFLELFKNKNYKNISEITNQINLNYFNSAIKPSTLLQIQKLVDESGSYKSSADAELPIYYYKIEKILGLMLSSPEFQKR